MVKEYFLGNIRGERGRPGLDGKDGIDGIDGLPGKDGRDGIDGKDGVDGKDGGIGNDTIGIINLIDFEKLYAYDNAGKIDNIDIENGIINYSSIAYYIKNDKYLKKGTHSFRVLNYTSNLDYSDGKIGLIIRDVVTKEVLYNITVDKNINYSFDILEEKEYSIEFRIAGVLRKSGFIEKPMLVEGDIPVLWNYEKDIDIDVSNKIDKQPTTIQYKIPTDFTTFYRCLEHIKDNIYSNGTTIKVLIESGHNPKLRAYFRNVDFSNVELHSEDDIVLISDNLSATQNMWDFGNSIAPNLYCLVTMGGIGNHGIYLVNGSKVFVNGKCGVTYAGGDGVQARSGSTASVQFTIFTNAGQNITGSEERAGISAWGSRVNAHGADVSGSAHHGARAAYSGVIDFEKGIANNCGYHGVRASNAARVSCPEATVKDNNIHGIYALNNSFINADRTVASGNKRVAYNATGGSIIHANLGVADGSDVAVDAGRACTINFIGGSALNCITAGIICSHSSTVEARNSKINGSQEYGIQCFENSSVNAQNTLIYGSLIRGLQVTGASNVNAEISIIRNTQPGNTNAHGVDCKGLSRINLGGSQVWNNGGKDLMVDSGSQISARLCLTSSGVISGGTNLERPQIEDCNISAFNTITRAGIIFD